MPRGGRRPGAGRPKGSKSRVAHVHASAVTFVAAVESGSLLGRDAFMVTSWGCVERRRAAPKGAGYAERRGGRRANAGRKRLPNRIRDRAGRIAKPPKRDACGCGGLKNLRAARCGRCYRASLRKLPDRACIVCSTPFRPKSSKQVTCGIDCGKARTRQFNASKRIAPDSARLRRRRASAARRRRAGGHHQSGRWKRICQRDGAMCWLCRRPIDLSVRVPHPLAPTVDHVVPLADGGSDADANLRPAHFRCNSHRGVRRVSDLEAAA